MSPAVCDSCGAPIVWGRTIAGRWMPVDAKPCPEGCVFQLASGRWRVLTEDEQRRGRESGAELWMPHWSSCPSAEAHRVSPDQLGLEL